MPTEQRNRYSLTDADVEQLARYALIIESHYGREPQYSYFNGCSTGGRQAVMAAQRYPEDFDGIIAGAPGYNRTDVAFQTIGMIQATHATKESFIPPAKYAVVHKAALDAVSVPTLSFPHPFLSFAGMIAGGGTTVNGEKLAWSVEEKVRGIVHGEDPANLQEGCSEEDFKALAHYFSRLK